ncbi:hypothetical protein [Coleofasciculus sp. FACHB-T130]|uniref:hypothetical protein n=1 Tax=Cyanophyceae TaxID=3028117 RepID=UPI0018F00931|nr:hypothetical protein [Coleofasciculus sp. FACHB-T130]
MLIALCPLEGRLNRKEQYALVDIDLILSQRSRELIDLEERGMVKHTVQQEKKVYSFASSMMEWWVIREIENSDNVELQNREKVFLKLMSREQAQRVKKVIQQVWQSREAAKSLIEWIVGTLKATS